MIGAEIPLSEITNQTRYILYLLVLLESGFSRNIRPQKSSSQANNFKSFYESNSILSTINQCQMEYENALCITKIMQLSFHSLMLCPQNVLEK
ncbi:hypothetical protein BpHYR1_039234 [Brachionus plicatilis]|uniref:Uncharacterized protein n=1 Tax=Brachionus plicatilis TaxID=10195 RepID=A0A3M7SNQ5_BRAPC|nr:hypothetical protein BpHYR1_039234 [Brachionus plicatilis]